MPTMTIRNLTTGETIDLARDGQNMPDWVYVQTETESPSELAHVLDQYDASAVGSGEDICGITVSA